MVVKKIGVFTFHVAHNYGAMLQAYALPTAVNKLGYDCEVVDYRFPYIYNWGKGINLKELIYTYGVLRGGLRCIKRLIQGLYNPKLKYNKFNSFRETIIKHSAIIYRNKGELCNLNYDAILFGSDQIWNEQLTNGVADEFFGNFQCMPHTKRIAYAASNGQSKFPLEYEQRYYEYLRKFSALGIREEKLKESLKLAGFDAQCVLDPTLLLTQDDWYSMLKQSKYDIALPSEQYLLLYVFDEDDMVYEIAQDIADKYRLKIVAIMYGKKELPLKNVIIHTECGPVDFVRFFANASFVVTTSFHGTAFSIMFHKDLYCIPHPTLHERTDSLLSLVGLENRNITSKEQISKNDAIDWNTVEERLENERKKSLQFLVNAIESE